MKILIAGLEIESYRETFDGPAKVVVHKLGTDARSWLTPAEARAVAAVIADAAQTAERKP